MIKHLMDSGLVRDAGVFASAAIGLQLLNSFKKSPSHPALEDYPMVRSSAFLKPMVSLAKVVDEAALLEVIKKCDELLHIVASNDSTRNGFTINRIASEIQSMVERYVNQACVSRDLDLAVRGMDYQRDELPFIGSICDNLVRNMLLDARPYA